MEKKNGRPLKFTDVNILQRAIDIYIQSVRNNQLVSAGSEPDFTGFTDEELKQSKKIWGTNLTVSGLALHLDISTETLRYYAKDEKFFATITRAKQMIENSLEGGLYGSASNGVQFNLINNFGWKNKTEVDQTVNAEVKHAGNVMVVPAVGSADEWGSAAKASQAALKEEIAQDEE